MGIFDQLSNLFKSKKENSREKQNKINSWGKNFPEEKQSSINYKEELAKLKSEIKSYGFGEKNPLEKLNEKITKTQEKIKNAETLLIKAITKEAKIKRTEIVKTLKQELPDLQTKKSELSEKIKQYNTLVKEHDKEYQKFQIKQEKILIAK